MHPQHQFGTHVSWCVSCVKYPLRAHSKTLVFGDFDGQRFTHTWRTDTGRQTVARLIDPLSSTVHPSQLFPADPCGRFPRGNHRGTRVCSFSDGSWRRSPFGVSGWFHCCRCGCCCCWVRWWGGGHGLGQRLGCKGSAGESKRVYALVADWSLECKWTAGWLSHYTKRQKASFFTDLAIRNNRTGGRTIAIANSINTNINTVAYNGV